MTTLLVMAKAPEPGRVKTRLAPRFGPAGAARLAAAALADTLEAVLDTPADRRVLVLDGAPGPWLPAGLEVWPQRGAGLAERIADAFERSTGPTLLIGMDTPQVQSAHLTVRWDGHDAWFGPAEDGGFWALGLREPDPALVRGVPMSTDRTGVAQLARLHRAGLRVGMLPCLRDVDTPACAQIVSAAAPGTRFAAEHAVLAALEPVHVR
ncbi:MAG: TIGR04282 family arsenosugar biosynthesis glycosyltransferase [Sporichthyaceae bacterium]